MCNSKGTMISLEQHKKILVEMLKYIDEICLKNNIKYSLLGGSLIGAIRHSGFIPWDDDIDIVLLPEEYDKLSNILLKENKYVFLNSLNSSYSYPFSKITDPNTIMFEDKVKQIENYGIYLDIFQYHYVSNNYLIRFFHYRRLLFYKSLLGSCMLTEESRKNEKNVLKRIRNIIAQLIGLAKIKKKYMKICSNKKKTNFLLSNWPAYGFKKEIQLTSDFNNFERVKFETIEAMITKEYDRVLTTTFGNYMELPPKEKRITHHITNIYWREENEKDS